MKDIIAPQGEASSYHALMQLWSTDAFKESAYIKEWTTRAAYRQPLLFTMTDPTLEWSHFTSYLGCLALRKYYNPTVQDLYYLHELIHIATLPYAPRTDFYNWRTSCFRNELTASMHSEVYVYFEIPSLRADSFSHEIWADRFLADKWRRYYVSNKHAVRERLRRQRKLVSTNPNPFDYVEQQIAGYFHQNMQWSLVWKRIYEEIDLHMDAYVMAKITPQEHKDWILEKTCSSLIPFIAQAREFSEETAKNKVNFGNHNLETTALVPLRSH